MSTRLERSSTDRVFSGVAGGMAEYFAVSPGFVRFLFVMAAIFSGGIFVIVYIALILVLPMGPAAPGAGDAAAPAVSRSPLDPAEEEARAHRRREAIGYLLVALGAIFLLGNFGFFRFYEWRYVWPLALIGVGAYLIVQRTRR